ncbi:PREDICTED: uncharacterized protein LOC108569107 [Nicrophorus vespilloides]|uniref:Uncharacterized protein LOC108569107 n=1 Tax=Nicrophorus vespilloides TaxID=110193 RepID=A0ABM1NGR7_NICVS|nr:PREDICTED: uncharacterized protein LOC108569107 [Nicrophorus vespilloides]
MHLKLFCVFTLCAVSTSAFTNNEAIRDRIIAAIKTKFENFNFDFGYINDKLSMFNLPSINSNLLDIILSSYNTSLVDVGELVANSNGNILDVIESANNLFECDLLYIEGDKLQVNLDAFNEITTKVKELQVAKFFAHHKILGYVVRKYVDFKNSTFYPEIKKQVLATSIPLDRILAQILVRPKVFALETKAALVQQNATVLEQILKPLKEAVSTLAVSMKDIVHRSAEEAISAAKSLYRDGEPEDFFESVYASTVNVAVLQIEKLLNSIVKIVDTFLDRAITDDVALKRMSREVEEIKELTFFQKLTTSINKTLKKFLNSITISLNKLTEGYLKDMLLTAGAMIGGLINKIFPNYEQQLAFRALPLIANNNF